MFFPKPLKSPNTEQVTGEPTEGKPGKRFIIRHGYSAGLRPNTINSVSQRATSEGNRRRNLRIHLTRDNSTPAPPPGGAPGASAIEECKPFTPPSPSTEDKGLRGRRQRRRECRAWRRTLTVPVRLHRLGKGVANGRVPLNAATKRSTAMKAAHIFKRMWTQAGTKGPQRPNKRDPATSALATPLQKYGQELKIGTQNVQGTAEILKHQYVLQMMREHSLDILVLTETRSRSYYTYHSEGFLFIVNGYTKDPYGGVTVVISPKTRPYIKDVIQHSSRLCEVTINCQSGLTHVLGAYVPHNKTDFEEVKVPFWDMLEDFYSATPLPEPIYIIGDFNVRLQGRSSLEAQWPHIFGKGMEFAQRKPTDNRTLFMNLLQGHDSVDCVTFKTPSLKQQVTFRDQTPPPKD